MISPRPGYFDSHEVTAATPPHILHDGNFLMLYNAIDKARSRVSHSIEYTRSVGWAVLYGKDPSQVLARSKNPIIKPEQAWEQCTHQKAGLKNSVMVSGMHALQDTPDAPVDAFQVWYTGCGVSTGVGRLTVRTPEYSAYIVTDAESELLAAQAAYAAAQLRVTFEK